MALFGTSPEDSPGAGKKSSLFADGTFGSKSSALFADDADSDAGDSSPWNMPAPKKAARRDVVKSLLPSTDVPESYVDAYDLVLGADENRGSSGVGIATVRAMLGSTHLNQEQHSKIINIIIAGEEATREIGRSQFNVLLALVGLAQEGEDMTLDAVDERRKRLPRPSIPYLEKLDARQSTKAGAARPDSQPVPPQSNTMRRMRQNSYEDPELDPWSSPASQRERHTYDNRQRTHNINGLSSSMEPPPNDAQNKPAPVFQGQVRQTTDSKGPAQCAGASEGSTTGLGWGEGFSNPPSAGFGSQGDPVLGGNFGQSGDNQGNYNGNSLGRPIRGRGIAGNGAEDVITINMLPEKEGLFMFQHRNYEVKSARRASSVIRRYSDFVWLVDCLHKRYPFRQIPLLPPKRISVNGTHLTADSNSFLEKRRRGLVRFANAVIRHPVLSQEQLVVMFLTVPTELAIWRKQATISVQEEFIGKPLPPDLEDSLPSTLNDLFETVRSGVRRSSEIYINLCNLLDRLAKRNQGIAAEQFRFSRALHALTDSTSDTYAVDTNDVPLLNDGINATAKHLIASQGLLEDEARAWDEGVLEDLKRQRDCLVAMRDMFDRKDRYAKDNIPQLEKRIQTNERKLQELRTKPEGTVKPGETEKVEDAIFKDKESIVQQHARGVLITECVRDELLIFQKSQYHISRLHQDWSQERVKYAELQADNWRSLCDQVEAMPISD